ncbi:MAG: hypothetical protein Q9204_006827 [Flavoplaca sp. TL-2023a]
MGVLSKILPDPAFKYLQNAIKPPKRQQGKSLQYSDTLIILKVPRDGSEHAFQSLKEFAGSVHDSCPDILRCEIYKYLSKRSSVKIHITLRFNSNLNAVNLQVDGLLFREWLEQGEAKGLWTCDL